jgi:hypothetical protein
MNGLMPNIESILSLLGGSTGQDTLSCMGQESDGDSSFLQCLLGVFTAAEAKVGEGTPFGPRSFAHPSFGSKDVESDLEAAQLAVALGQGTVIDQTEATAEKDPILEILGPVSTKLEPTGGEEGVAEPPGDSSKAGWDVQKRLSRVGLESPEVEGRGPSSQATDRAAAVRVAGEPELSPEDVGSLPETRRIPVDSAATASGASPNKGEQARLTKVPAFKKGQSDPLLETSRPQGEQKEILPKTPILRGEQKEILPKTPVLHEGQREVLPKTPVLREGQEGILPKTPILHEGRTLHLTEDTAPQTGQRSVLTTDLALRLQNRGTTDPDQAVPKVLHNTLLRAPLDAGKLQVGIEGNGLSGSGTFPDGINRPKGMGQTAPVVQETTMPPTTGSAGPAPMMTDGSRPLPLGLGEGLVQQVLEQLNLRTWKVGQKEVRIQLHPEEMGRLRMEIGMKDHQVVVRIHVDNPMVKDLIENSLAQLRDGLLEQGLRMDKCSVMVSDHFQQQAGGNEKSGAGSGEPMAQQEAGEKEQMLSHRLWSPYGGDSDLINLFI